MRSVRTLVAALPGEQPMKSTHQKQPSYGVALCFHLCVAIGLVVLPLARRSPAQAPRPNIVLMMADDLGFSDIGCYGGEIQTPNLDRLAAGGLRYTQFYNAAKCHTTRASLVSGLYPHQTGCELPLAARATKDTSQRVVHSGVSIAAVLRDAGYATYASGKWHAGGRPMDRGFEQFFGLPGGACSYFTPSKALRRNDQPFSIAPDQEFYFTDAITDQSVMYLAEHFASKADRPFFLYVAYTAPHWPLQAHAEDIAKYRGVYAEGWEAIREQRRNRLIKMGMISADWRLAEMDPPMDWQSSEHLAWQQRRMEVYAAMVDRMDQGIGRIVDAIRERAALDNTVVIFLSDNGGSQEEITADTSFVLSVMPDAARDGSPILAGNDPAIMPGSEATFQTVGHDWGNVNNTPFRYGKVRVHEGGIASPLIVHWPAGIEEHGGLAASNDSRHRPAADVHAVGRRGVPQPVSGACYRASSGTVLAADVRQSDVWPRYAVL